MRTAAIVLLFLFATCSPVRAQAPPLRVLRYGVVNDQIVDGRVIRVDEESVLVDVGFKSEGVIGLDEWEEHESHPEVGQLVTQAG